MWLSLSICLIAVSAAMALRPDREDEGDEKGERSVKLAETPKAVRSALIKAAGDAVIQEVEVETEGGVTLYEASWTSGGVEHEVCVDKHGQVLETESVVSAAELPKAVHESAVKHLPKQSKISFEKKTIVLFSAETTINGKERELLIDPAGRLLELEADDEHDHHEDGDEDDDDDDDDDEEEDEDD